MQLLVVFIAGYVVLVHGRHHLSLPARLGALLGMAGGYLLGVWLTALGIHFPFLPLIYAAIFGCFVAARFHRLYQENFEK